MCTGRGWPGWPGWLGKDEDRQAGKRPRRVAPKQDRLENERKSASDSTRRSAKGLTRAGRPGSVRPCGPGPLARHRRKTCTHGDDAPSPVRPTRLPPCRGASSGSRRILNADPFLSATAWEIRLNLNFQSLVQSVARAHANMGPGRVFLSRGELPGASINRSPSAYNNNPQEERERWAYFTLVPAG